MVWWRSTRRKAEIGAGSKGMSIQNAAIELNHLLRLLTADMASDAMAGSSTSAKNLELRRVCMVWRHGYGLRWILLLHDVHIHRG